MAARLIGLWLAVLLPCICQADAVDAPWRVLVLNDGDPALPAFVSISRAMRASLNGPGLHRVEMFDESLDMLRFPERSHEAEMAALLSKKYAGVRMDAVVAIGTASLDFAERNRALWPGASLLFQGVSPEFLRDRKLPDDSAGWFSQHDLGGTVAIALKLRPSTRHLVVIAGSSDFDRRMARLARIQLAPYSSRLLITYWEDQTMAELARRVQLLDRNDAVLFLSVMRDRDGSTFTSPDVAQELAAVSRAPVYGPFETYLGRGIVAGTMYSFEARGQRMGHLVHEVLSARPAHAPGLVPIGPSACMADATRISALGLSVHDLPGGCEIRFPLPSFWQQYGWWALATLIIIAAQFTLIAGLAFERRARMKAEKEVRHRRTELAQAARLALAGELTASIAHEINQPLGAILANAGAADTLLERSPGNREEVRAILGDIQKADIRASEIIRRVKALVTARETERDSVDPNAMVVEALGFLENDARRRSVSIETMFAAGLPFITADRVQLQQAIVNLCMNAMEAMTGCIPERRRLMVYTRRSPTGGVEIVIGDNGVGISPGHLPQLFDAFFTTKAHGTGLGLSITRSIVVAHHGTITAENRLEGGALFRITLPAAAMVTS
jgi:signal transduction histidine kinase